MKKISIVLGANYGDEGKGLITDYLSSKDTMVVRFSGGAQAGHTVVTPDGDVPWSNKRHVFHHFGSGSFRGASTFLSKYFICNPMFFNTELKALKEVGCPEPVVYIDPRCPVTTPWDLMLNQTIEEARGEGRHGSCGMGINETVTRNEDPQFVLTFGDTTKPGFFKKLEAIRDHYVPLRMDQLKLKEISSYWKDQRVWSRYILDLDDTILETNQCLWEGLDLEDYEDLVFEGAQGLKLDMDDEDFPHVTRSKTTSINALALIHERFPLSQPVDTYYVTRTYLTRHGRGPLPNELPKGDLPYPNRITDETNVHNAHQEHLRFAYIDLDDLVARIAGEMFWNGSRPHLALTCADQCEEVAFYESRGNGFNIRDSFSGASPFQFAKEVSNRIDAVDFLISSGPTRKDIVRHVTH
jgi:adenylosuccinate synthase